jgi:hypothetical protein
MYNPIELGAALITQATKALQAMPGMLLISFFLQLVTFVLSLSVHLLNNQWLDYSVS